MIRLALVGIGGYGAMLIRHIRANQQRLDCRIVAAADLNLDDLADKAKPLADEGVRLYRDAVEMFSAEADNVDGVYIASSIFSHAKLTVAAARAGLHVHLEKPPAATVQEVDEMIAALGENDRFCLVGFQALQSLDVLEVARRVDAGKLGQIESITCWAAWPRKPSYYARNDWAGKLTVNGKWVLDGPATNALNHQIANMLRMVSGAEGVLARPTSVRAELYAAGPIEGHSTAAIRIATEAGVDCTFLCSHCTEVFANPQIRIHGSLGQAHWDYHDGATITYDDGQTETIAHDSQQHARMIEDFVQAVRAGTDEQLKAPLEQTRHVIAALNGAHESSGQIHRVPDRFTRVLDAGKDEEILTVPGVAEACRLGAMHNGLISDLPDPPEWACPTEPFDLTGYRQFPQRFSAEGAPD